MICLAQGQQVQISYKGEVIDKGTVLLIEEPEDSSPERRITIDCEEGTPEGEKKLIFTPGSAPKWLDGWLRLFSDPMSPEGKLVFSQREGTYQIAPV